MMIVRNIEAMFQTDPSTKRLSSETVTYWRIGRKLKRCYHRRQTETVRLTFRVTCRSTSRLINESGHTTRRVQIATKTHCNVIRELCHTRAPCHRQAPSWMCWSHLRGRPGSIHGGRLIVTSMITNGITMPHYENMSRPHSSMGPRCWVSSPDGAT